LGPRKSGIPQEVLIPAPVWNTKCFDSLINFDNSIILRSSSSSESKS
jgi:hypothetical protein